MTIATAVSLAARAWTARRVGDVCQLVNGYPFDSELFGSSGDFPLLRIRDLLSSDFDTYVDGAAVPPWAVVQNGDLVIGMDGEFNSTIWNRGPAALNQRLCLLRETRRADIRFVAYALPAHLQRINDLTYSTTVKHLSSADVLKIHIQMPGLDEQRAIVEYLDRETGRIDALIAKQEQLVALLESRKRVLVDEEVNRQQADFIQYSLRMKRLYRVSDIRAVKEIFPLLSVSIHDGVRLRSDVTDDLPPAEDLSKYKVVRSGDLVVNRMRAFQGALGVAPVDGIVSPDYLVLRPSSAVDSHWLELVLRGSRAVGEMTSRLRGIGSTESGSVRTPRINAADLGDMMISLPVLSAQRELVRTVADLRRNIEGLSGKVASAVLLLRERRHALISAAVTGYIRGGAV